MIDSSPKEITMSKPWIAALAGGLLAVTAMAQDAPALKDQKEKLSYALGANIGANWRKQSVDIDPALVGKGLADAFSGGKMLLTAEEIRAALSSAQEDFQKKQTALRAQQADAAKKDGEAFLAANKPKEGVIALPSGLQYKILKAGTGPKPTADDTVVCQYRGTLIDGTEFDSSYKRNQPAAFPVKGVIKGWTEALQLMPVGSKWQLFVPPDLAYGEAGAGGVIPPNSTLIFEVELMSIKDKEKEAKP
jgi:FKBP-type peptidyl-prolyl cis-trans isomerase FklB